MEPTAERARIALVRHGETVWSAGGRHTSVTDVDLTAHGIALATRVPTILALLGITPQAALASPRLRARRTAELAGFAPRIEPAVAEWEYGAFEGLTSAQIRATRPNWTVFDDGCPGGESPAQVGARADRALELIRPLLSGGDVVVFSHGHFSRVLAVRWVGLAAGAARILAHDPAAVTVLALDRGTPVIQHANVPAPS